MTTPTLINVKDLIGENAITLDDGQKLYDLIYPKLKNSEKIELDFSGVLIFASPFMNAAIGQLLRDISADTLNKLLVVNRDNITPIGLSVIRRVIENAKKYYDVDEKTRQAIDIVVNTESEEM